MRIEHWALSIGLGALTAAGCASAQAKTAAAGPPLEVPAPPPRVLAPVEEPAAASTPAPEAPAPAPAAAAAPRTPPRPPARRTETDRPETPAPAASAGPTAPEPPRELRPTTAADAAAERQTRDALARAATALSRVDYGRLNADARAQYDQSKRFMEQAQQAMRDRNFMFASTLADKAATLAEGLQIR